ncbi:hypothetical protein F511_39680 [Dorcoceras hygrometricum]|uniref:Integrase catalytic domain-containing protein n=1 Tax=Dorcoceras hygrometricum TaxID=472368 RepID=A0A2Z7CWC7_9LAMI|nr:hypothetical protein F511_39680 [Dorcoceras hygrometricum]
MVKYAEALNKLMETFFEDEAKYVLREIHEGCYGNHLGAVALARKALLAGFFWPTMQQDATTFVRSCQGCQSLQKRSTELLRTIISSCPFDQWGMDIVGPFPPAGRQRKFLLVAVDYFSKWVEAEPLAKISEVEVLNFLWNNIVCRFGIPRRLISDNGRRFCGEKVRAWCQEWKIEQVFTLVAYTQSNGQVEVTNRAIVQALKARFDSARGRWADELPSVLGAYRTTARTATGETPYCMVYGTEAPTS